MQLLDAKQKKKYEEVQNIMSREKNFQNFRAHLHKADPPCIPYLGLYLTDLTFIEDGNKDTIQVRIFSRDREFLTLNASLTQ